MNYVRDKKTGGWGRSDGNVSGFSSCSADGKILPRPLIMPSVIEPDKPKGLPIATTPSPTLKAVESPIGNGTNLSDGISSLSNCRTARSEKGSPLLTWHYMPPSRNVTWTFPSVAPPAIT